MRHEMRRTAAGWRACIIFASLVACSVYDAPPDNLSPALSSGAAGGDSANDQGSSSGGANGGGVANGSTSGSTSDGAAGGDLGGAGKPPSAGSGGGSGTTVVMNMGGAPDAAGAGGMPNAGGEGGASPVGPTTFRYIKLEALTEQNGHVWSSVAELGLLTTDSKPLSSSGWSISADSEETSTEAAPATNAIDGKSATYWHTHWTWDAAADAPLPHYLIVDLGAAQVVTGFTYLPRQDNKVNGRIKDWAFYVSSNGTTWGSPVATGSFPDGSALQTVTF
jgi:hypothetical protein